jgi:hypothetical protein
MVKATLFVLLASTSAQATSFFLKCKLTSKDKDKPLYLELNSTIIRNLGAKSLKEIEVSPSTLQLVQSVYGADETETFLLMNGSLSHLNTANREGVFKTISGKSSRIEINGPGDIILDPEDLKKKQKVVDKRQFKIAAEFKPNAKRNPNNLESLELDVKNSAVADSKFYGKSSVAFDGQSYENLSTKCTIYIDWATFSHVAGSKKK